MRLAGNSKIGEHELQLSSVAAVRRQQLELALAGQVEKSAQYASLAQQLRERREAERDQQGELVTAG